ncbi:MAG: SBBP repeat-containing protein [Candidatus Thorarchaeota archaeon]
MKNKKVFLLFVITTVLIGTSYSLMNNDVVGCNEGLSDSSDLSLSSISWAPPSNYSRLIGGIDIDSSRSIAVDSEGCTYITGYTYSEDFPTTPGAYDVTYNGLGDIFVCKFSVNSSTLIYSTFIGGNITDRAYSIDVDSEGCAYITGFTSSYTFPTTFGAMNLSYNGGEQDIFVCKLSADGSTLLYSTYIGGSLPSDGLGSREEGWSIEVDSEGCAFITGFTSSSDFPVSYNTFDRTFNGGWRDIIVCKLNAEGTKLLYSTFLGGDNDDWGTSITLDHEGYAFITGFAGDNFPTTTGAFDESHNGLYHDVIVCKLNKDGSTLIFSTYIGGEMDDWGSSIAIDSEGCAYITGDTHSDDFPTTPNAFDPDLTSSRDTIVCKLSDDGSSLHYSTYLGGSNEDWGWSISVDSKNCAYVIGVTQSDNFPTTQKAFNRTRSGMYDIFFTKFNVDGSSLLYSTFIGGRSDDLGLGSTVRHKNSVYITGFTKSDNFPICYYNYKGENEDAFIFKLDITIKQESPIVFGYPIYSILLVSVGISIIIIINHFSKNKRKL